MKFITLIQYKNSNGVFQLRSEAANVQQANANMYHHLAEVGVDTHDIAHLVTVEDDGDERKVALHLACWGKPVIYTPAYGQAGYNQNGLDAGVKNYRWCMTCGGPLPQHYLELAQRAQQFVKSGYPICDNWTCQDIDRIFKERYDDNGIGESYPIADVWHAYNPVTRNKLVRAENGAVLGEEPYSKVGA